METVLITGGSGLVGTHLTKLLLENGYAVSHLSRTVSGNQKKVKVYKWDLDAGFIEETALTSADYIVHLAGANIGEKKWTAKRKKELYDSRIVTTLLLREKLKAVDYKVKTFISASAIGYYGNQGEKVLHETDPPGKDFLANLCIDWESQAMKFKALGIKTVINRTGLVLSRNGGALPRMDQTLSFGFGNYLGSGKQYYSWIHIDDLCRIILHELKNHLEGVYNAVTPNPVTNKAFMRSVINHKNKHALLLPAPAFALRLVFGELATTILGSQRCSAEKVLNTGYQFKYPTLPEALTALYS